MEYGTIEKMLAGDFAATIDWNGSAMRQRLQNPAIKYVHPKEGFVDLVRQCRVLKEAQNVENAKLFQNFIMDPENAALISAFAPLFQRHCGLGRVHAGRHEGRAGNQRAGRICHARACLGNLPARSPGTLHKIWTEVQK